MAYRGNPVPLPVGLQGFSGSKNPSKMGPGHFSYVEGVDIDGGVLVKDGGAEKFSPDLTAAIRAGINWSPVGGVRHDIIFLDDGDVKKDTGAGTFGTDVKTGLDPVNVYPPVFVTAGGETVGAARKLFMFTDSNQVQVLPGTTNVMADIATPAADWSASFPIFGCLHGMRMWAGGNAGDPHRLYYSQIDNNENFTGTGSGSLPVFPGEGETLVGAISFRGLLLVFKRPKGIYVIDNRDPTPANWQVTKLNDAVGAAGPRSFGQISNDIVILDPFGNFHLMTAVTDFGDINASNIGLISEMATFMRREVSLVNIHQSVMAWNAGRSQAWFYTPLVGAIENNLRIRIDFSDPQSGPRYLLSRRDVAPSLWMRPDAQGVERPTTGDDEGFVWLMEEEERNKDGDAYPFEFETADTDFSFADPGLAHRSKNGQFIEVTADIINATSLNMTPYWDGVPSDPINFELGGIGAALGSFTLDVDALASAGIVTERKRLTGSGRRLKLAVSNDTVDDEVRLSQISIMFTVGDERTRND
jgi:hypothetical protein